MLKYYEFYTHFISYCLSTYLYSVHLRSVALEAFLVQILTGRETDKFPHYFNGPHDICACILESKYVNLAKGSSNKLKPPQSEEPVGWV